MILRRWGETRTILGFGEGSSVLWKEVQGVLAVP